MKNKIERMMSSDTSKINQEKEETEKKHRKNQIKNKTSTENTKGIHKVNKSDKSLIIRNYKMSPHQRARGKTIYKAKG